MRVTELNHSQLIQLKIDLYVQRAYARNESVSWAEIEDADWRVPDEEVFAEYADVEFSEDDFW